MGEQSKDQLHELLKQRIKDAEAQAILSGGAIPSQEYEALRRLARLIEIRSGATPTAKKVSRPTLAVFGLTLIIVSVLFFARVSETEIELDVALSQLGFRLPQQQILTEVTMLPSLGVSGLAELGLPRAGIREPRTILAPDAAGTAVRLSSAADGQRKGELTLDALNVPAATQVWLRPTEVPRQWRLSLHGPDLAFQAAVDGPIRVGLAGVSAETLDFTSPQAITMRSRQNDIDLDMEFPVVSKSSFTSQDVVEALSFTRVDEHSDAERTLVRRISTILSGSLYLEALAGREMRLRSGEGLRFEWSHGEIRTLELRDGHIALTFHGDVRGMTTGAGENRRSLMPTYLEWLSAQHGLSLLWGTTLYVFGLVIGLLRKWGVE